MKSTNSNIKEQGIFADNQSFKKYEQVQKNQSYLLAEIFEKDQAFPAGLWDNKIQAPQD